MATLNGTTNADSISLSTSSASNVTVDMQGGNDTVSWDGSTSYSLVDGGLGTDTLNLTTTASVDFVSGYGTRFTNFEVLNGSTGNDYITASTQYAKVDLGTGNDTFTWNGASGFTLVDGGSGTDTLVFSTATTLDFTKGAGTAFKNFEVLTGSSGADAITATTQFGSIDLGLGNDTMTWNGETKFTSVNGGSGTDTLILGKSTTLDLVSGYGTVFSNFETLIGSSLADIVKATTNFTTVDLAGGNDTFTWAGATNFTSISGGSGIDTLVMANGGTLDLTSGYGTRFSNFEILTGSSGNDYITANTQYGKIDLGLGNDQFTWNGVSGFTLVDASTGTDTLVFSAATTVDFTKGAGTVFKNFEALTGSSQADTITATTQFASIDLGLGNDTMTWNGETKFTSVNGGSGTDTLILGKSTTLDLVSGYGTVFSNFETLIGSSTADIVKATTNFTTVDLAEGNDTFTWSGATNFTSISGGSGIDTLVMASGGTLDLTSSYGTKFSNFEALTGSSGNDYVTAGTQYAKVDLGMGNDTFTWNGASGFTLVDASTGTDTLVFSSATTVDFTKGAGTVFKNFEALTGSSQADTITATTQFASIDLGLGNDTMTWNGETKFTSVSGGSGTDTLILGKGTTLDLVSGYGTVFSNFETLIGSSIADIVKATTNFTTVDLAGGNDTFTWAGATNFTSISGGSGIDTLVMASGTTLDLTSGYGTKFSNFEALTGSSGNDYVTATTQYAKVDLGLGNDQFTWNGVSGFTLVDASSGSDTLVFSAATTVDFTKSAGTVFKNFEALTGSSQADTITATTQFASIDLGLGNDTMTWNGETKFTSVSGGSGTDTLILGKSTTLDLVSGYGTIFSNFETLIGSSLADNVKATTNFTTVDLGGGNDSFTWAGATNFTSISGGSGTDTLVIASGGTLDLTSSYGTKFSNFEALTGSSGNDFVTANTQYGKIDLGIGNDTLTWNGVSGFTLVDAGTGTDTLVFSAATTVDFAKGAGTVFKNFETLTGSSGADAITATTQFGSIDLGLGNDTMTWNGETKFTSVSGGSGTDTLILGKSTTLDLVAGYGTVFSNFETLIGSSLADNIKATTNFTTVDLGGGNDSFTWAGATNFTSISGGSGTDTLVMASGTTLDLTSGYGTKFSNFEALTGSSGNDFVTANTQYGKIDLGIGNDTFTWNGVSGFTLVDAGTGTDTLVFSAATTVDFAKGAGIVFKNFEALTGSSGADTITATTQFGSIDLGLGNDTITWNGETKFTSVSGGSGTDTLILGKSTTLDLVAGYGTVFSNFETLIGSSLTDNVKATTNFTTVDLGGGNDNFTWAGATNFTSISGGSGTDTLVMASGGTLDLTSGYGTKFSNFESLTGSSGNDFVTATTQYAKVDLGLGNDQFTWNGVSGFTLVDASSGSDTLVFSAATTVDFTKSAGTVFKNFETLTASSQADTITATTQFASIDLGLGNDTMTWNGETKFTSISGGSGTDTLVLAKGTTLDLVSGYGTVFSNFETLIGSSLADNVKATTNFTTVDLGGGNDSFTWAGVTNFTSISGGSGTDTLVMANGTTLDLTSGYGTKFSNFEALTGSSGNDYVTANTQYGKIDLGIGNDTFTWNGVSGFTLVDGSSGTDTLVFSSATTVDFTKGAGTVFKNFEVLTGSSQADAITATTQFGSIDLGLGNDTMTWNGETKFTNVSGGSGTDTLILGKSTTLDLVAGYGTIFSNFETLIGSSLADNVKATTNFTTVDLGGGNDNFTWGGATNFTSISGGSGTDTLVMASGTTLDLTSGYGTKFSNFEALTGSSGNDYVTATTQYAKVDLGMGNDTFTWNGVSGFTLVDAGTGTDTLVFSAATTVDFTKDAGTAFKNFEALTGSSQADTITATTQFASIDLGLGNDTMTWNGETKFTSVSGGSGTDTLILGKSTTLDLVAGYGTIFSNFETLIGSSLADNVKAATNFTTVDLGGGNDSFTWAGATNFTSISGGSGTDTLVMASGTTLDLTSGYGTKFSNFEALTGSSGNDFVTANTQYGKIDLGLGNDQFTWNGVSGFALVDASTGTDTLVFSAATTVDFTKGTGTAFKNFEVLTGSSGADTITATTQFGSIDLGLGNDTMTWNGETKFTSVSGGSGTDTLILGKSTTLDLVSGYGTVFSNFETLIGSSLVDIVKATTNFTTVDLGGGNDSFTWAGATNFTSISGGSGIDTLVMATGATLDLTSGYGTKFSNFEALTGSSGNDFVTATTQYGKIDLALGNDQFTWNGVTGFTLVDASSGSDTLVFSAATTVDFTKGAGTVFKNFEALTGSSQADTITATTQFGSIDLGLGNDTMTWNGETKFTSVNGGSGTDTLILGKSATLDLVSGYGTVFSNFETLIGSSLADIVRATTNFTTVDLGGGNDTFTWAGATNFTSISGGSGTDTLVMASGTTLDLTSGYGTKFSNFEALTGSSGNDFVTANTQYAKIDLGAGNDTFTWNGVSGFTLVDAGTGTDTLVFSAATTVDFTKGAGTVFKNFEALTGSSGADTITATTQFGSIDLGLGNDTITWNGETKFTSVSGGSGTDTLILGKSVTLDLVAGYGTVFSNFETLIGSSTADIVKVTTNFTTVDLSGGNDAFTWAGATNFTSISGGSGIDTLVMATGATLDLTSGYGTKFSNFEALTGSSGNDFVTANTQYAKIDLGIGNDTFTWNGVSGFTLVDAGTGTDTLVFSVATTVDFTKGAGTVFKNFEALTGSSGADTITATTQFGSIDLGLGNDTITWNGETKFTSVSGGSGTDTLILGKSVTLDLVAGYGTVFSNFETLIGSSTADIVKATTNFTTVDLSGGNDIFTWAGATNFTSISGGSGTDTLVMASGATLDLTSGYGTKFSNFEALTGSTGNDFVTANTQYGKIDLGLGNDQFTWNGVSGFTFVDAGTGTDTLVFSAATTVDFTKGAGTVFKNFEALTGSSQADNITATTQFASIDLGLGNDTMTWNGETKFTSISGGSGTDTLVFSKATSIDLTTGYGTTFTSFEGVTGSSGADWLKTSSSYTSIDLGSGNDTFVWTGATNFSSINGGSGIDTLIMANASSINFNSGYGTGFTNFEKVIGSTGADYVQVNAGVTSVNFTTFSGGVDAVSFNTGYWGTSAVNVNFGYQSGVSSHLDLSTINIVGYGGGGTDFTKLSFNYDGSTNASYTLNTVQQTNGDLTISFSGTSANLGSINLVGGDQFWGYNNFTHTGMHLNDKNSAHTMFWTGSSWA
ncbi:beta strand repeat-containing protein [Pelosinus sp. sgz500959]|uniref:beta strand repeat-containing protein n=1 Tax=Pelosinus sp. sgz500959 TaxID=3242472 RepID=UPI00366B1E67